MHRRRVAWMQEGFAPFFEEAGLAHKWLRNPPACTVAAVKAAPAEDAAWQALPVASLVEGNYGKEPDLATQVRMARHGDTIHVRVEAAEPTALAKEDRLTLRVQQLGKTLSLTANGEGKVQGELGATLLGSTQKGGVWTVAVSFPAAAVGLEPGKPGAMDAQIERHRAHRGAGKGRGTDYFWMPPMKPPWDWPPRFGKLRVEATQ